MVTDKGESFWLRECPHSCTGHYSKQSFRPNEQLLQVESCRRKLGGPCSQHAPVGHDRFEAMQLGSHRAVFRAEIAEAVGGYCSTKSRHWSCPWIMSEKQSVFLKPSEQFLQHYSRLSSNDHVFFRDLFNTTHALHVHHDSAAYGYRGAHESCSGTIGNNWGARFACELQDFGYFHGGFGSHQNCRFVTAFSKVRVRPVWT